jgi:hypothetical protein
VRNRKKKVTKGNERSQERREDRKEGGKKARREDINK